ncbi:MAG: cytochrome c-type biogenesis protein CcmH [Myxococcota bacterium]|nr:cytochrome c-type biogenesis protein CcmH [Myxococcota bacterium]
MLRLPIRQAFTAFAFLFVCTTSQLNAQSPSATGSADSPANRGQLDKVAQRVSRLSDQMNSPYCKGKTLKTCTSPNAATLRREIEVMMRRGLSDDEVIKQLQVRFPETTLSNPEQPWYTFFVPFFPYIFGASIILVVLMAWRRGDQPERVAMADVDTETSGRGTNEEREDRLARLRSRVHGDD